MTFDDWTPQIVAVIGSSRFKAAHLDVAERLTREGAIVLLAGAWHHADATGMTDDQKHRLDDLTLKKIALSSRVFVVNVVGYLGESTLKGIAYARELGKPVEFLVDPVGEPFWSTP